MTWVIGLRLDDVVNAVKEGLRRAGAEKVAVSRGGGCVIVEAPISNDVIVASVAQGSVDGYYVVKLVPASKAAETGLTCVGLEYTPYGLFIISDNLEEITEKVAVKASKLLEWVNT